MNNRLDYFKLSPQASNKLVELTLQLSKKPLLADLAHLIMLLDWNHDLCGKAKRDIGR